MAKCWFSYTTTAPTAPARNQSSNYVYVKTLPSSCCNGVNRPCAILATGSCTTGANPTGITISSNLQSYLTSAIGSWCKFPTISQPFIYLKA